MYKAQRSDTEEWVEGFYVEYPIGYAYIQDVSGDRFPVWHDTVEEIVQ